MSICKSFFLPAISIAAIAFSNFSYADTSHNNSTKDLSNSWLFHFDLELVNVDSDAASETGLQNDSASAFSFEGEYFLTPEISAGMGLGLLSYADKTLVGLQDEEGNQSIGLTSATATMVYGEVNYRKHWAADDRAYWLVGSGYTSLHNSKREADICSNCPVDEIDISGGLYASLGAGYRIGKTWAAGLYLKNYLTGDLSNAFGVNVTFSY